MHHSPLSDDDAALWAHLAAQVTPHTHRPRVMAPATQGAPTRASIAARREAEAPPEMPTPRALPPLHPLPQREAKRQFKSFPHPDYTLDLHGMTQHQAHEAVERCLLSAARAGIRHVAIITGKGARGEGVLRRAVPQWLQAPHLRAQLSALRLAPPEAGGEGVLHVLLKAPR